MNYYSGGSDEFDDEFEFEGDDDDNDGRFKIPFQFNIKLVLLILAIIIAILIFIYVKSLGNTHYNYKQEDKDSSLSRLYVYGGELSPSFASDVVKYNITAVSDEVSFSCEASSKKAKVEGCDEVIKVTDEKIKYNIKVTAEDSSVTRYYLTIEKGFVDDDINSDNTDDLEEE